MKYLPFISLYFILTGILHISCTDKKENPSPQPPPPAVELGEISTNTVTFKITGNAREYAWQISTNLSAQAPSATVLFGTANTGMLAEGEETFTIGGLEGNTDYLIHLATKSAKGFSEVVSQKIKTLDYKELLTISNAEMFTFSYHIKCEANARYKHLYVPMDQFRSWEEFGWQDPDWLEQSPLQEKGPRTFTITNGDTPDPENPESIVSVTPGDCYMVLAGECDEEGSLKVRWDEFEEGQIPTYQWTGFFGSQKFYTVSPLSMQDSVGITITNHTTKGITFRFTPQDNVVAYSAGIYTREDYDKFLSWVDKKGISTFNLRQGPLLQEAAELVLDATTGSPLEKGTTYVLGITSLGKKDASVQNYQYLEFKAKDPTLPVPTAEVKAIDAPSGNAPSPYTVWFNAHVTSAGKAVKVKYACNYTGEVIKLRNSGLTDEDILEFYGIPVDNPEVITAINSAGGFDFSFDSFEDRESTFIIGVYNSEESIGTASGKNKTIPEPAAIPVQSTLFTELTGDWTATITKREYNQEEERYENTGEAVFKVTIANAPEEVPGSCPDDIREAYKQTGKTDREIDELYNDFKATGKHFGEKYRNQNRVVCRGFDVLQRSNESSQWTESQYYSPLDLFGTETPYQGYDNTDLYNDYGPKWFLQISDGDRLTLVNDPDRIAPLMNYSNYAYYLYPANDEQVHIEAFPASVSADKQTITVHKIDFQGQTYYPSVCRAYAPGYSLVDFLGGSELVLTKGWTPANRSHRFSNTANRRTSPSIVRGNIPAAKMKRTPFIGKHLPEYRPVRIKPTTPASIFKHYKNAKQNLNSNY